MKEVRQMKNSAITAVFILVAFFGLHAMDNNIQKDRASKMTVVVQDRGEANNPLVAANYPALSYFDGGQSNQVYVFSSESGNRDDWQLEYALNDKTGFIGDAVDQQFHLLMCAPKALPEDQLLRYMWSRDNASEKNVIWKGFGNLPRMIDVPCE